jgi:YegS/Rv2252/BmrU family lipid kinase
MIAVVMNPASRNGRTLKLLPKVTAILQGAGKPHEIYLTKEPNDATTRAKRFAEQGAEVVIAVGGDGTFNEVANGIVASGKNVPLGLVPSGAGSDFVRTSGAPTGLEDAFDRALNGSRRTVDIGRATFADGSSRIFINLAGIGIDAEIAERAEASRLPGSTLPYLWGLGGALFKYEKLHAAVEADGQRVTGSVISVLVANAKYAAGGMYIAPMAEIDDGFLDVAIIGDFGKFELVRQMPNVYRGKHISHPKFAHLPVRSVRVETNVPARVQVDGELHGMSPVTFSVEPGALTLAG